MPVKIIAVPDDRPGLAGRALGPFARHFAKVAEAHGHRAITGYTSVDALFAAIQQILKAKKDCLEVLEIFAHGSPETCDGLAIADASGDARRSAATFASKIAGLRTLCDHVDIYLSGCNTGLVRPSAAQAATSIAEQLAAALPRFEPGVFEHRIRVFGTRGYFLGSHMQGDGRTDPNVWGKLTGNPDYPAHPDSFRATGSGSYRPFSNG